MDCASYPSIAILGDIGFQASCFRTFRSRQYDGQAMYRYNLPTTIFGDTGLSIAVIDDNRPVHFTVFYCYCNVHCHCPGCGVLHIKPFFLLVDIQHTQCPRWFFILERYTLCGHKTTTQAATLYQVDSSSAMPCHKMCAYASYPDTLEREKKERQRNTNM